MAVKCPKCGGELVQATPEIAKCKKCGAAFKRKGTVEPTGGAKNNGKRKKKDGGAGKIVAVILVLILLAIAIVAALFLLKEKGGQEEVNITIPADFINGETQVNIDKQAEEYGYKFKENKDGSVTCTMTKSQHKKMMSEFADSINQSLDEMIGSESYPNFTDIKANDNFTEFTVTTKSSKLDMVESFSVMSFYIYGGLYNVFNGQEIDNVSVTFVNADSGEVIEEVNSSDMNEME